LPASKPSAESGVQADQAAGLRRMREVRAPTCITGFFVRADGATMLMHALADAGKRVLLVDRDGRHLAGKPARSLFDWRRQLNQARLQVLPLAYGDGLFAPGVLGGEAAMVEAAQDYDCVLFDPGPLAPAIALDPDVPQMVVLQLDGSPQLLELGYALLKSLVLARAPCTTLLCGFPAACRRLVETVEHCLGEAAAAPIWAAGDEDAHLTALAARIVAEETGRQARVKAGVPSEHG
jgi:hypothetical protein